MNTFAENKAVSLQDLAAELDRQKTAKRDFIADTRALRVEVDERSPTNISLGIGSDLMPVRQHAVRQIGSRLGIPAKFADRLAENHADMLAWNIGQLFEREPETRMLRCLDDEVRGFVSDNYRPLDNADYANAALPELIKVGADVQSCALTETRMLIKALIPGLTRELVKTGSGHHLGDGGHNPVHVLTAGCVLSNSEVGAGALTVMPGTHEARCSNLATFQADAMRKYHVGGKQSDQARGQAKGFGYKCGAGDSIAVLSAETRAVKDRGFWLEVRDLVRASVDGRLFEKHCREVQAALDGTEIERPEAAIRELPKVLPNLTEADQDGILAHLVRGGDLSQYGMQAAITSYCQTVDDYEKQTDLQSAGGRVIQLPPRDWARIATATVRQRAA